MKTQESEGTNGRNRTLTEAKAALRNQVASVLTRLPAEPRVAASARARALLEKQANWREAGSILFFAPLPMELDIWPLIANAIAAGKTASLPRFMAETAQYAACRIEDPESDVRPGRFGIREPLPRCPVVPLNRLDFILVPGVAFDLHGRRLGRGKGFYDQLLAAVRGTTCGVAFDEQIVRAVPVEPHDVYLNCILTPTRWIEL
jgi:5-formyltetrahydrofolate cyclo-ligase